ncbi:hypothetical protein [Kosakonia phage Kc283]|uniref:Uncharacterized protein n=1 Tax=Kosakonia phage Kc283 TaxID=2863195 RepID=A0AAE7WF19_9CAUD|nr:hypothetical protein PP755_gp72 [Kosakonia phage Kc283]QYN79874.1 hypothetical protein [Kosakonia phage Kc283]
MGLFGSKKKTYRDFSYSRLIEDEYLPDIIGQAITTYVLDEDNTKSLADLMIEYGWKSNNVKWNAAWRWANKPDKYYYGNPTSTVVAQTDFTDAGSLNDLLVSLTGHSDLTYVYSKFGPINMRHAMWQLLINTYGYSASSNELTGLNATLGAKAYLHDARNMLTPKTVADANLTVLEHWGYPPTGGPTPTRAANYARADTLDGTSTTDSNYVDVQYASRFIGVKRIATVTTTKVDTTVKTPNGSGGYDEETTTSSSDETTNTTDWNGQTLPTTGIISQTETQTGTNTVNESDPPTTTSTTDPTTGVITEVTTTVSRVITTRTVNIDFIARLSMGFGIYDFIPDTNVDTDTVLDDNDTGNYEPNAPLDPSGESGGTDDDYFQVCFTYPGTSGLSINYFTYQYGSGTYPDLDGITSSTVGDFGKGYPRMYFRLGGDRLDQGSYVNEKPYNDSIKLGNKLDLPWLEILDQIYQSLSSLSKIRDVFMIQCIPANTTTSIEQEYLYNYFRILHGIRNPIVFDPDQPADEYTDWNAHLGCTIDCKDNSSTVGNSMDALGYRQITGTFGAVGATASGRGTGTRSVKVTTTSENGDVETNYRSQNVNYHFYRVQTTATYYEEVRVYNLSGFVRVGGKNIGKSGDDENLMVPLDYAFRKMFSAHDRETLYARATHIVIGTEYTVKTKWYQTGIFKAVVVVIAVALSWWTGGASLTLVGAITAAASAIGAMVVMSLLSKYVFSKLGGVFAIVAAVVAIAVAIYTGYLYFSGTTGPFSITATQMMQVSNVAFKAAESAQQGVIAKEMQRIATLEQEIADKQEALEVAQKELENPYNTIEDGVFLKAIQGYTYLGEQPQEYYSRTLNTNIGVETNNLVDMYFTQSLQLPSAVSINQLILQNMQRPFELFQALSDELNN